MDPMIQKAKAIFVRLLGEIPSEEWDAHVQTAWAGDESLRQHVLELLGAHSEPDNLLDHPAPGLAATRDVQAVAEHLDTLGVLLYELLTGTTPFSREQLRQAGPDEIRRMIREDEPRQPSERISTLGAAATTVSAHRKTGPAKLRQLLRRDLDWIVMKAIQRDRRQRYQTASDFARDVQRYLADEPIEARLPSLADRTGRWARRHRPLVASAAVLLVLYTIGSLVSALLTAQERKNTMHAYEEKNSQVQATQRAETRGGSGT